MLSPAPARTTGWQLRACPDWSTLCAEVTDHLSHATGDLFDQPTVVVRGAAQRRSLRQWTALEGTGSAGRPDARIHDASEENRASEGICAGIDMVSLGVLRHRLEQELLGLDVTGDPWSSPALVAHVTAVMQECGGEPWFALVQRHLDGHGETRRARPGRIISTARRYVSLITDYARYCGNMLIAWEAGRLLDVRGNPMANEDIWQAELFSRLVSRLEHWPQPSARARKLCARIGSSAARKLPQNLGVISEHGFPPSDLELLAALSGRIPVTIWQLGTPAAGPRRSVLARRYDRVHDSAWRQWRDYDSTSADTTTVRVAREDSPHLGERSAQPALPPGLSTSGLSTSGVSTPSTVLTRMQRDLRADITPDGARIPDDSVRFHMCHGPDRQVEVLREILCDLFDTDPTLQPRDVVVVCTDLTRYAPLLSAHLAPSDEQGLHPGHLLRARLSDSPGESNQIRDLLVTLLELPDHRATAADLVEISSIPAVAAHFDLEEDDLARLPELFSRAQIRWGIDAAQRRRQGLGAVRQGTWISGIDRLLAGIVLADSPLTRIDTVVPVEHVEGSDVSLIGAIAELVSRIRMHLLACGEPASIATWTHRLESMLRDLVSPLVAEQNWQLNQVTSRLGELAQRCPQNSPVLSRNDIAALLRLTLPARHRSVVLGSGDLEICALGEMGRIPHRVVCLLGVDDQHLPRPSRVAGDDLLARPGVDCTRPDRAALDRQGLIDALMGATERLVIIGSGADPLTGAILPEPVIISDLLEATGVPAAQRRWPDRPTSPQMYDADALIRWHPLQPHSAANFRPDARGRTFSFDAQALKGALRLDKPVEQNPPRPVWRISMPEHLGGGGPASLRDVADFYQDPAASWFRHTFGFLPTEPRRELPVDLPVELDGLERFTLGTSMFGRLLDGEQPEHVVDAALLSGALPPGPPGIAEASSALPRLMAMVDALNRLRIQPTEADVLLDDDGIGVIGRITSYAGALVSHRYGRIRAKDLVAEWVTLLIAQSAGLAVDRAVLVGRDEVHTLLAPAGDQASIIAGQLLGVYLRGTHVFLPLPPETAHCQAQLWSRMGWSNAETRSWEVAKAFRRETQYSVLWAEHLGLDWDQLRSMAPEPADPVNNSSSRFVNLCSWLYLPLVNHHQSAPLHEFQCETSVLQGGC